MIPLDEARAHVLGRVEPLRSVRLPVDECSGLVLAEPVRAGEHVPPFDNAAMDGYAVRAVDTTGAPVDLEVVATLAAGADPAGVQVGAGQAVRIMTGAVIPEGADAIVMVESTAPVDGGERVRIETAAVSGDHIRGAGDDVQMGDVVIDAGTTLTPVHLGVLASVGLNEVVVVTRPKVGVLSTGDELVTGGAPLRPGQLRDSNRHSLRAVAASDGFEVVDLGLVRDDKETLTAAIEHAATCCDALLTSGGVSMGDFDEVKAVLSDLAEDMRWMQVAIRPAKPFAFGTVGVMPVFGLPGNPVSSLVSYELLARPALRRMRGHRAGDLDRPRLEAVAEKPLTRRPDGKTHFARVVVALEAGKLVARSAGGQGSHQLAAMAAANGLAVLPDGDGVGAGETVSVIVTGDLVQADR
ncbi:MAG TPA: gephyrin-like molybdotransferase Glp [Acidimicrobiales bacterium]|nr:gephyrin-like molybdotransferase Glp [Acidimicrobiales bacterium]